MAFQISMETSPFFFQKAAAERLPNRHPNGLANFLLGGQLNLSHSIKTECERKWEKMTGKPSTQAPPEYLKNCMAAKDLYKLVHQHFGHT